MDRARDWRPVTVLCEQLLDDADQIVPKATAQIRRELPGYEVVPLDEHRECFQEQTVVLLSALADARPPGAAPLESARKLAQLRAAQGLPVQTVIAAYQIGNREIWEIMRARAGAAAPLLPEVAGLMWRSMQVLTSAIAAAHVEVTRTRELERIGLQDRLHEHIRSGSAGSEEAADVARALGYDPAGSFQAVTSVLEDPPEQVLARIQRELDRRAGVSHCLRHGRLVTVLTQGVAIGEVLATLERQRDRCPIGVGMPRGTLPGGAQSVRDAERAMRVAVLDQGVSLFERDWLRSVLLVDRHELVALVEPVLPILAANEHLIAAVHAFAMEGFSVTGAARALHVHPNTAAYRLDRWQQVSGLNPRDFDGLMLSMLAYWLAAPEAADD